MYVFLNRSTLQVQLLDDVTKMYTIEAPLIVLSLYLPPKNVLTENGSLGLVCRQCVGRCNDRTLYDFLRRSLNQWATGYQLNQLSADAEFLGPIFNGRHCSQDRQADD